MRTLREFALKTKLDKIGFLPGDIIHGDLYIYFEQPAEIQAIEIFLYGIGCGAWLEQCDLENLQKVRLLDSSNPRESPKKRKLVDVGLLLFGFAEPRNNKALFHKEGRYVYEFEINIPERIPYSFKSPTQKDLGYARYYLKAVMSRPKKRVKVTKVPIVINELLDPDRPDLAFLPGSFQEKNLRTACLPTGSFSLECHLSKSHYIQGERILIQALAQNCSPKVLKEMYAKLVRRVRCKSSFGTNTFTSNEASIHGTKIPAQSTIEWKKEELKVPPVGPTIAGNREIRIDYMVRIGMYEDLGCEVHLDLPVVIGTVGLADWTKDKFRKENNGKSKSTVRKQKAKAGLKQKDDDTLSNTILYTNDNIDNVQTPPIAIPHKNVSGQPGDISIPRKKHSADQYDSARGIQKALNDIDDDVSRIKRRLSEAKESVSRSFDLDFEFDKISSELPKHEGKSLKVPLRQEVSMVASKTKEDLDRSGANDGNNDNNNNKSSSNNNNNNNFQIKKEIKSIGLVAIGNMGNENKLDDEQAKVKETNTLNLPSLTNKLLTVNKCNDEIPEGNKSLSSVEMVIPSDERMSTKSHESTLTIHNFHASRDVLNHEIQSKLVTQATSKDDIEKRRCETTLETVIAEDEIGKQFTSEGEDKLDDKKVMISKMTQRSSRQEGHDVEDGAKIGEGKELKRSGKSDMFPAQDLIIFDENMAHRISASSMKPEEIPYVTEITPEIKNITSDNCKDFDHHYNAQMRSEIGTFPSTENEFKLKEQVTTVDEVYKNMLPANERCYQVHLNDNDNASVDALKYSDVYLSNGIDIACKEMESNHVTQLSEIKPNNQLFASYEGGEEDSKLKSNQTHDPLVGPSMDFEPLAWTTVFQKYGEKDISKTSLFPIDSGKKVQESVLIPTNELRPWFAEHSERMNMSSDTIIGSSADIYNDQSPATDFKAFAYSVERERKELDHRVKRYLHYGGKHKPSSMCKGNVRSEERSKGYYDRMNKSMDAIRELSSTSFSDEPGVINVGSVSSNKMVKGNGTYYHEKLETRLPKTDQESKNIPYTKRPSTNFRNQKRFPARINAQNARSTDSLSSDDQIIIDFGGVDASKTFGDITNLLDDRVRKYLKGKEDINKEYTDTTAASSTTPISSATPTTSATPASSMGRSSDSPPLTTDFKDASHIKPSYKENGRFSDLSEINMECETTTKDQEASKTNGAITTHPRHHKIGDYFKLTQSKDRDTLEERKVVMPYKISDDTALMFLKLTEFTSDRSNVDEFEQYFENVTYKFLNCLQTDTRGIKIEYTGGFLETIRKARYDIVELQQKRLSSLKTIITNRISCVINNLESIFEVFDNNFENVRQRIIISFRKELNKMISSSDIRELEECLVKFHEDFDYRRDKYIKSIKEIVIEEKVKSGEDLEEHFVKFEYDFHHIRHKFITSLKNDAGSMVFNSIDDIKLIFYEFDNNFESSRKTLIEILKRSMQHLTADLLFQTSLFCASFTDNRHGPMITGESSQREQPTSYKSHADANNGAIRFRGDIQDVKYIISRYFLSDQNSTTCNNTSNTPERCSIWGKELIKEIEGMGYNIIMSEDNKLTVTDAILSSQEKSCIIDDELSRSLGDAFSHKDEKLRNRKEGKNRLTIKCNEMKEYSEEVTTSCAHPILTASTMSTELYTPAKHNLDAKVDENNGGEKKMAMPLINKNIIETIEDCNEDAVFDEAFFPVFDKSEETNTDITTNKFAYVPVPYEQLIDETEIPDKIFIDEEGSFQVNLTCKSDSEEKLETSLKPQVMAADTLFITPFSSEESDFNGYGNQVGKSTELARCENHLEKFDHVFEALRQNFLQCLKSEQRVRSKKGSMNLQDNRIDEFEIFNKLDEDFEEIRHTFIQSLKNEESNAIDSIEESLGKFDDNFEEIREKFVNSLKGEKENVNDTTLTDLEVSIDRFDDDFEELRQKFMDSLRKESTDKEPTNKGLDNKSLNRNEDNFEELRHKFLQSLKMKDGSDACEDEGSDCNRTYTKITPPKLNTTYTKIDGCEYCPGTQNEKMFINENVSKPLVESQCNIKMNDSFVSPCLSTTFLADTPGAIQYEKDTLKKGIAEKQDETSQVSHCIDVSWLDLNNLGQFGPEEFSAGESRCILPSCGEIVILQEPHGMPQFTKYSYSPQHIKNLKDNTEPVADEDFSGTEFSYKTQKEKTQSKIRAKLKLRGKFMSRDVHIVTDEPKHVEPSGSANRSWLDLNTIGQLGPEEEISGDNQFLLPTGKEVIILGEGKTLSDSDHLAQLSNLRRKSLGKVNEVRRRSSTKENDIQQKFPGKVNELQHSKSIGKMNDSMPRTTSVKMNDMLCTPSAEEDREEDNNSNNNMKGTEDPNCTGHCSANEHDRQDNTGSGIESINTMKNSTDTEESVNDQILVNEDGINTSGSMKNPAYLNTVSHASFTSLDENISPCRRMIDDLPSTNEGYAKVEASEEEERQTLRESTSFHGTEACDNKVDKGATRTIEEDLYSIPLTQYLVPEGDDLHLKKKDNLNVDINELEETIREPTDIRDAAETPITNRCVNKVINSERFEQIPYTGIENKTEVEFALQTGGVETKEEMDSIEKIKLPYNKSVINLVVDIERNSDIPADIHTTLSPLPSQSAMTKDIDDKLGVPPQQYLIPDTKYLENIPALEVEVIEKLRLSRGKEKQDPNTTEYSASIGIVHSPTTEVYLGNKSIKQLEDRIPRSLEPSITSSTVYGETKSFVNDEESGAFIDTKEVKDEKEIVEEGNTGFILRATNYMKNFFRFSYSDRSDKSDTSDKSDNENIQGEKIKDEALGDIGPPVNLHNQEDKTPLPAMTVCYQGNLNNATYTHEHVQSDELYKQRPKQTTKKHSVDMDATDNFIEDLPSLVTDETETSELATTGDSSVANVRASRKIGPEERYCNEANFDGCVYNEIPVLIEQMDIPQRKNDITGKENSEISEEFKKCKTDGIDMDATENLIEDIYLVTDEPDSSETRTVSSRTSNRYERRFSTDDKIVVDKDLPEKQDMVVLTEEESNQERLTSALLAADEEFHYRAKKSISDPFNLGDYQSKENKDEEEIYLPEQTNVVSGDVRFSHNEGQASDYEFESRAKVFTHGTFEEKSNEYVSEHEANLNDYLYLNIKTSKHIGPEEVSSVDDKSILALDKDLFIDKERTREEEMKEEVKKSITELDDVTDCTSVSGFTQGSRSISTDNNDNESENVNTNMGLDKHCANLLGFKHGPEEWVSAKEVVVSSDIETSENEGNFETIHDDMAIKVPRKQQSSAEEFKRTPIEDGEVILHRSPDPITDLSHLDLSSLCKQTNLSSTDDTYDVVSTRDVVIHDDSKYIRQAKRVIYGQNLNSSNEYIDGNIKLLDPEAITEVEPIVFDVVVDFKKSRAENLSIHDKAVLSAPNEEAVFTGGRDDSSQRLNEETDNKYFYANGDLEYPEFAFTQLGNLEELKMLHLKTYSETESGTDHPESNEDKGLAITSGKGNYDNTTIPNSGEKDGTIPKVVGSTRLSQPMKNQTLSLCPDQIKHQERQQVQNKRIPPSCKRKRKLRERRSTGSPRNTRHLKTQQEIGISNQPLDLQVSLVKGKKIIENIRSNKDDDAYLMTSKKKNHDAGCTKHILLNKANIKRREWKLDFGGNLRPTSVKEPSSKKEYSSFVLAPDPPNRKSMKEKFKNELQPLNTRTKRQPKNSYHVGPKEKINTKEKKSRALKVINLTVEKDQEFKRLSKAVKKKLNIKKDEERHHSAARTTSTPKSKKENSLTANKKKSSYKREDKSGLIPFVKKLSSKNDDDDDEFIDNEIVKECEKKKRRISAGKFSTSSSEDTCSMPHAMRLEADSNKRNQANGKDSYVGKGNMKGKAYSIGENIKRKKENELKSVIDREGATPDVTRKEDAIRDAVKEVIPRRTISLSVEHESTAWNAAKSHVTSLNTEGKKLNDMNEVHCVERIDSSSGMEGINCVAEPRGNSEGRIQTFSKDANRRQRRMEKCIDDKEEEMDSLMSTMLTSSFRSRAANKLSSPDYQGSDNQTDSGEGGCKLDEIEYEIDWENLKRGIKDHDSSSSYFTAEEVSKPSSSESAGSTPREVDDNAVISLKMVVDSSEAPEVSSPEVLSDRSEKKYYHENLFFSGNINTKTVSSKSAALYNSVETSENYEVEDAVDLMFTWDNAREPKKERKDKNKNEDESDQLIVVDRSSSDRDSGITSSGEETSKTQISENLKQNFLERSIYKLQSISEEDKLTDDDLIGQSKEGKKHSDKFNSSPNVFNEVNVNSGEKREDGTYPYSSEFNTEEETLVTIGRVEAYDTFQSYVNNLNNVENNKHLLSIHPSKDDVHEDSQAAKMGELKIGFEEKKPLDVQAHQSYGAVSEDRKGDEDVFVGEADPTMYPLSCGDYNEHYQGFVSKENDEGLNLEEDKVKTFDCNKQHTETWEEEFTHTKNINCKEKTLKMEKSLKRSQIIDELNCLEAVGVYEDKQHITEDKLTLYPSKNAQTVINDVALNDTLNRLFNDTCPKEESDLHNTYQHENKINEIAFFVQHPEVHKFEGNVKASKKMLSPANEEEDIFLKEFERLREFERLEEAFQEGKAAMATRIEAADKSDVYDENSLSGDVITVSTETTNTTGENNFYVRAPMTPITEESGSSIEEAKSETRKQCIYTVEGKSSEQVTAKQRKDDNCLLLKPSKTLGDNFIDAAHKSTQIKKKTIKNPKRAKKQRKKKKEKSEIETKGKYENELVSGMKSDICVGNNHAPCCKDETKGDIGVDLNKCKRNVPKPKTNCATEKVKPSKSVKLKKGDGTKPSKCTKRQQRQPKTAGVNDKFTKSQPQILHSRKWGKNKTTKLIINQLDRTQSNRHDENVHNKLPSTNSENIKQFSADKRRADESKKINREPVKCEVNGGGFVIDNITKVEEGVKTYMPGIEHKKDGTCINGDEVGEENEIVERKSRNVSNQNGRHIDIAPQSTPADVTIPRSKSLVLCESDTSTSSEYKRSNKWGHKKLSGVNPILLDTSGLDIIVTEIRSSLEDEVKGVKTVKKRSSYDTKKKKEKEVNKKVLKVIKLFTEAISRKEVEDGVAETKDNCFSQQIMNSIFNAAHQSAYFEEESTADIMKAYETQEAGTQGIDRLETRNIAPPSVGTAVQQYKKSIKSLDKSKKLSPRQNLDKIKNKANRVNGMKGNNRLKGETMTNSSRETRSTHSPRNGKLSTYGVNNLKSRGTCNILGRQQCNKHNMEYTNNHHHAINNGRNNGAVKTIGATKEIKHNNNTTQQGNVYPSPSGKKIKSSTKSRKYSTGTYVSPYRQQLRKTIHAEQLPDDDNEKEDEYQEIEVDVKIKVTQVEENPPSIKVSEKEKSKREITTEGAKKTTEPKRERSKSRNNSLRRGTKTDTQGNRNVNPDNTPICTKIRRTDESKSGEMEEKKSQKTFLPDTGCKSEAPESPVSKSSRDLFINLVERNEVKRSSSEVSSKDDQLKRDVRRDQRRSSTPVIFNSGRSPKDKLRADTKSNKHNASLKTENKVISNESEIERRSSPYIADLGTRGPIFPYVGYMEKEKFDPSISERSSTSIIASTQANKDNKEPITPLKTITSSEPVDTVNTLRQGGTFDSSFAIMNSMSNEFNCDDMLCQGGEEEKRDEAANPSTRYVEQCDIADDDVGEEVSSNNSKMCESTKDADVPLTDVKTNNSKQVENGVMRKKTNRSAKTKTENERKRGRRCKSVSDDKGTERKHERKSRSLESNGRESILNSASSIIREAGPKKATSCKIYHTLPASTGGANLYVESRGAILPYIGHIERLDVEISKSESEVKQVSPSQGDTNKRSSGNEPVYTESPTATVRSSTPNNLALEVKIPLPTELSSSLEHSDSPTLTFNIDVSLDNSNDQVADVDENKMGRKARKAERYKNKPCNVKSVKKGNENERVNPIQSYKKVNNKNCSTKTTFANSSNVAAYNDVNEDNVIPQKLGRTSQIQSMSQDDIDFTVQVNCTQTSQPVAKKSLTNNGVTKYDKIARKEDEETRDLYIDLATAQRKSDDLVDTGDVEFDNKMIFAASNGRHRSIYPYNHFIAQLSPSERSENKEKTGSGKTSRKSWPTDAFIRPFENQLHSPVEGDDQTSPQLTNPSKQKCEERVCLGGGLVFNISKKQALASRLGRKQCSPRSRSTKRMFSTSRTAETRKISKSSSMPSRSVTGYISRCHESIGKQPFKRLSPSYGLKSASMPSFYRTPSTNIAAGSRNVGSMNGHPDDAKSMENGLNEEKVNNLVCDIKDAGATISDILDEMQALKMFLNEEDETNTSSHGINTTEMHTRPESTLLMSNEMFPWQPEHFYMTPSVSSVNSSWETYPPQETNGRANKTLSFTATKLSVDHHPEDTDVCGENVPTSRIITTRSQSFKNKLKEELARTISATLQEIHPFSNRFDNDIHTPVSYTSASADRVPSMDDTLREIRISTDDMESELVTTTIQLYNVTFSPELPTYTLAKEGHSACTYMHSSLDQSTATTCCLPVPSIFDMKAANDARGNPLSTETKYTTILPPEINASVKINRAPPKSYVRPIIFNKMLGGQSLQDNKPLDDDQSLDSGLYNTNSTDDYPIIHPDMSGNHSKGTRESFEQHEISLGIIDENGRLRRNSDLVKDHSGEGLTSITDEKGTSQTELDTSSTRIEGPDRERTFIKSHADSGYQYKAEESRAPCSTCRGVEVPKNEISRIANYNCTYCNNREQNTHTSPRLSQQVSSTCTGCVLSPDVNRYDSTAPGIPHGSFSYEEEIIETYKFIDEPTYIHQTKSKSQDSLLLSPSKSENVNICYKSSTNYYPVEIENYTSSSLHNREDEGVNNDKVSRELTSTTEEERFPLECHEISKDFEDDSISKTRSHDFTDELLCPINILNFDHNNKNCL